MPETLRGTISTHELDRVTGGYDLFEGVVATVGTGLVGRLSGHIRGLVAPTRHHGVHHFQSKWGQTGLIIGAAADTLVQYLRGRKD